MAPRYPGAAFVEARNYTKAAGSNGTITRVVIHDMEMAEKGSTAESCAAMFHGANSPQASAHFMVDCDSVIQGVDTDCRAWHAPPNAGSIGIEHAGFASQNLTSWLDAYGKSMLAISARLTAWLCKECSIPIVKISASDLLAGKRGICGHNDVSAAWHQADHTDPGNSFPWDYYIAQVKAYSTGNTGGTEVALTDAEMDDIATRAMQKTWSYVVPGQTATTAVILKHAFDQSNLNTQLLQALTRAEAGDDIDVTALARALAAILPTQVVGAVDPAALADAVAAELHARLAD